MNTSIVYLFDRKAGLFVLKEAIRLAQEISDHVCLQHALAWLYTLSPIHKVSGLRTTGLVDKGSCWVN